MARITDGMTYKADRQSLVSYCHAHGIELKREGNEFVMVEHDSVYISAKEPYKWYRHSTGQGGYAIRFLRDVLDIPFREAVFQLLEGLPEVEIQPASVIRYTPDYHTDQKRVIAYLCKTRGIDYDLVTELIRDGKLRQDTRGNCAFISANTIELHGTGDTRFKGQVNEQNGYGFELTVGERVESVIYAESAIDLLSLYQLYKGSLRDALLVSMGGLKSSVVANYQSLYPDARHCLAVDNDEKGLEFAKELNLPHRKPDIGKDWNEQLKQSFGKKIKAAERGEER